MTAPFPTDRPLRLLVDGHTFDTGPQGTTTFLAGLLNALPAAAKELGLPQPDIVCAGADKAMAERVLAVPFRHVAMRSGFVARNAFDLPRLSRVLEADATISQYVRPLRVHGHSVSVIHDVLFLDFPDLFSWRYRVLRQALFGWSARRSDSVFTVSAYSRSRIAHWFGIDPDRIRVVPNGVEAVANAPEPPSPVPPAAPDAPVRLISVSRLEQRKRQDWCIALAEELAGMGQRVTLDLVGSGSGPYAERIRALVAEAAGRGIAVTLSENIPAAELHALMDRASIALFPSRCEGFSIPIIEASARGIPCVVAHNTAPAELRPWYAGPAFPDRDYADFAAAVRTAIGELPALRSAAAELAPAVAREFAWPRIARAFLAGLQEDMTP